MASKNDYEKAKDDPLFLIDLLENVPKIYHNIAEELIRRNVHT